MSNAIPIETKKIRYESDTKSLDTTWQNALKSAYRNQPKWIAFLNSQRAGGSGPVERMPMTTFHGAPTKLRSSKICNKRKAYRGSVVPGARRCPSLLDLVDSTTSSSGWCAPIEFGELGRWGWLALIEKPAYYLKFFCHGIYWDFFTTG